MSVICLIGLSGCTKWLQESIETEYEQLAGEELTQVSVEDSDSSPAEDISGDVFEPSGVGYLNRVTQEELNRVRTESEGCFYFESLSEDEKQLYLEIYVILTNLADDVMVSELDMDKITHMLSFVLNDHPEIYYVDGYEYQEFTMETVRVGVEVKGTYSMTQEEISDNIDVVSDYVEAFMNAWAESYPDGADDYEKTKFVYEYIIRNTEYVLDCENNQNIISVMKNGTSVCNGYAKTTQLLLTLMGIDATLVTGEIEGGGNHAWNLVKLEGEYYYIDTTWGDSSYIVASGEEQQPGSVPSVCYDYLLYNDNMDRGDHIPDEKELMPKCESIALNYYHKEGLYFESVDKAQLTAAFNRGYERNDEYVILKMSSNATYKEMVEYLLGEQKAFDYIDAESTIHYAQSPDRQYLAFWLR